VNLWNPNRIDKASQFSEMASFRLCTQGLRALEQYENEASENALRLAEENLGRCIQKFPSDLLPKFYLGTVKTLKGYGGLDEAKLLFTEVMRGGDPSLAFAAKYNLAVANVEEYTDRGFSEAQKLLDELVLLREIPKGRSTEKTIWSAKATLLYIRAHRIWKTREEPATDEGHSVALALLKDLLTFHAALEKSDFRLDRDVLSDYWNARGTVQEYLAFTAADKGAHDQAADLARRAFQHAVEEKVDYVNSYSNLARLEGDVFHRYAEARKMWESLLNLGKREHYIRYNLGKISEREGKREEAIEHYTYAAPEISDAKAALNRLNATQATS
jgi:tetratricopeptide (TPR) repeat protein